MSYVLVLILVYLYSVLCVYHLLMWFWATITVWDKLTSFVGLKLFFIVLEYVCFDLSWSSPFLKLNLSSCCDISYITFEIPYWICYVTFYPYFWVEFYRFVIFLGRESVVFGYFLLYLFIYLLWIVVTRAYAFFVQSYHVMYCNFVYLLWQLN